MSAKIPDPFNWPEQAQAQLDEEEGPLAAMYRRAYAAYPEWLGFLRQDQRQISTDTLMVCDRLPEMASALFVAGYVTALVDEEAAAVRPGSRG